MTDHPREHARSLAMTDVQLLAEADELVRMKRYKSRTAALSHLAEIRGIFDERGKRSLVERIRQRAVRQNIEFRNHTGASLT